MDETAITALPLAGDQSIGFGIWSLIADADPVVKTVLLLLALASLWSWTIIFDKALRYARLRRRSRVFERAFWSGAPLDDLLVLSTTGITRIDPAAVTAVAAERPLDALTPVSFVTADLPAG